MNRKQLGDWGEALVAAYLRKRGYRILASQYRCRFGEVDLIAQRGEVLCFVEVKTRTNLSAGLPREAVGPRKRERLAAAARCYLSTFALDCPVRFDVAEVYAGGAPGDARIQYLENAFCPER